MAKFYEMPAVSPTMELGTIVAWRIAEGEPFAPQSVIAEVGTDKANMEAEIFDKGVMLKHLVAVGDEVPPGFPIAIIGDALGEDVSALVAQFATMSPKAAAPDAKAAPTPAATPIAAPATEAARAAAPKVTEPAPSLDRTWRGKVLRADVLEPHQDLRYRSAAAAVPARTLRVVASPLAKSVAAALGVNLATVTGSGPGGRIVQADVEKASGSATRAPTAARADEVLKLTQMRKTIAKRLLASHQDIPTFFLTVTFDMTAFVGFREQLKKQPLVGGADVKVSHNDVFIACVARALREYPKANAAWGEGVITRYGRVDIGVAVAIDDGLITPVLRNADQLRFDEIGAQIRELAGRARSQKLKPEEFTGSTFTISNLGMYDIEQFTAIINPPEAAILAVGSIAEVPVAKNGTVTTGWRMKVTMTCDHRVIDGATGAAFLQVLRRYVEAPMLLLL